jgi:hypothetical protein
MTITDMIISALLKKGIMYEAKNVNTDITIPNGTEGGIKINFKCDNMSIKVEKGDIKNEI